VWLCVAQQLYLPTGGGVAARLLDFNKPFGFGLDFNLTN
jgi:hypothetical protein